VPQPSSSTSLPCPPCFASLPALRTSSTALAHPAGSTCFIFPHMLFPEPPTGIAALFPMSTALAPSTLLSPSSSSSTSSSSSAFVTTLHPLRHYSPHSSSVNPEPPRIRRLLRFYSPSASSLLSELKLGQPQAPGVGACFVSTLHPRRHYSPHSSSVYL